MIRETIKSLFTRGSFTQDVAIVGGGKVIVAIIGFIFIPILSRIYTPEAYGIFSLYNASVSILVIFFTLGYPYALVIVKEESTFFNLFGLSLILTFLGSIISFIIIIIFKQQIISLFDLNQSSILLLFIPLGIIINGFIVSMSNLNVRRKNYKLSASLEAGGNLLIRITNLVIGLLTGGHKTGLIIGNQVGRSFAVVYNIFKNFSKEKDNFLTAVSTEKLLINAKKYIKYPFYILPSNLLNTMNSQLPIYLIGGAYGNTILGNFSMSSSLLSIPIQIIGNSLSVVFLKNASTVYHKNRGDLPDLIQKMVNRIYLLSLAPFAFLTIFGDVLLKFILGSNWEEAGFFASLLSPYFFFYIVFSPINSVLQIFKKENIVFRISILKLIVNSGAIIFGIFTADAYHTILYFASTNLVITIFEGGYILKQSGLNYIKFIFKIGVLFVLVALVFQLIKLWVI